MKVTFKYGIKSYTGTADNMTYASYRNGELCVSRVYVYPTLTANNHNMGAIATNLGAVYHTVSADYLANLKTYALRNGQENVPRNRMIPNAFALMLKMMYAWYESDPTHVDLTTITVADIISANAPVKTIAGAITAGFLPGISTYDDLTAEI
jgi:hypothetical protein